MFALLRQRAVPHFVRNARQSSGITQEQKLRTYNLMKKLSIFGVPIAIALTSYNAYKLEKEHRSHPRKEFIHYPYLKVRERPFPWGDGHHTLFHGPRNNYVPGVGYEQEWYTK